MISTITMAHSLWVKRQNLYRNAHKPNIHPLNSDTHTLFLSILILNSQCVGFAIEGIDIWHMVVINYT